MSEHLDLRQKLDSVSLEIVRYGTGFLNCRPERWFPNFAMQWTPIMHSLNLETQVVAIKPALELPSNRSYGWVGSCDDEPFAVVLDAAASEYVASLFSPNMNSTARKYVEEYLARRFMKSLSSSWSGPAFNKVHFDNSFQVETLSPSAGVKLTISINAKQFDLWIVFSKNLLEKLDGLWRRQTQSIGGNQLQEQVLDVEIAAVGVPVAELSSYIQSGQTILLSSELKDQVNLITSDQLVATGKLLNCDSMYAIQVLNTTAQPLVLSDQLRMSVVLGEVALDPHKGVVLSSPGTYLPSNTPISNQVQLKVNNEVVATGRLVVDSDGLSVVVD